MKLTRNRILGGATAAVAAIVTSVMMLTGPRDLQGPIDAANCGDTITLEAGAIYAGVTLPVKPCTDNSYITIQSSRANELPAGKRVSPAESALFAKVQPVDLAEPAIKTAAGAHHYRLIGLEISAPNADHTTYDLVRIGDDKQTDYAQVPHHIDIDHTWIHGFTTQDLQRGISLNGAHVNITNSYISDIHGKGYDTQAICGWNGPGPFKIINNYLEGAGENVMFGGAWAAINGLVPTGIEVRGNYFKKPLSWYDKDPSYAGIHWTVKNLFELKNARNVVVQGNVFDGNWTDAQAGRSIAFTPRPSDSGSWAVIEDVDFSYNIVRNNGSGIILLGADEPPAPTDTRLRRVKVTHNVWEIDGPRFGSNGTFATIINKTEDVTIEHNTVIQTSHIIMADYAPNTRLTFRNNIVRHNEYGVFGSGIGVGNPAIAHYFTDSSFTGNVIAKEVNAPGNVESNYPSGNFYPNTLAEVIGSDYRVLAAWKGKIGGKDPGADIDALNAALGGAVQSPTPTPSATATVTPSPSASASSTPLGNESADGTKGTQIVDSDRAVWTIQDTTRITLRNGANAGGGQGTIYKYVSKVVYVNGLDTNWYRWAGSGWEFMGPQEPGATATPTPTPIPPTCTISAPASITITRNGSGTIAVTVNNLTGPTEVQVLGSDGQVTVSPLLWTAQPTSGSKQFGVRAKNKRQIRTITFQSQCGSAVVRVNVV